MGDRRRPDHPEQETRVRHGERDRARHSGSKHSRSYRRSRSRSPPDYREPHNSKSEGPAKESRRQRYRRSTSRDRRSRSRSPRRPEQSDNNDDQRNSIALQKSDHEDVAVPEKQRPNFGVSGKLAAETNTILGTDIVLKYNEPPEARKPPVSQPWRVYVFKGKETIDEIDLFQRSCWLFGRERVVSDYHVEHPSVSKQHAVVQFRYLEKRNEYGDVIGTVRPYLIDLESANGTRVNEKEIPASRYYELRTGDVVSFGDSTREYVLLLPPKG